MEHAEDFGKRIDPVHDREQVVEGGRNAHAEDVGTEVVGKDEETKLEKSDNKHRGGT